MEIQNDVLLPQNQQPRKGHQSQVCVLLRPNAKIGKITFCQKLKNVIWPAQKPQQQNQHLSQVSVC